MLKKIKYSEALAWAHYSGLTLEEYLREMENEYPEIEIEDDSPHGALRGRKKSNKKYR